MRSRRVLISVLGAGAGAVLLVAALFSWNTVVEIWTLRGLEDPDPKVFQACWERLLEMRSRRAISRILEIIEREGCDRHGLGVVLKELATQCGGSAIPRLLPYLDSHSHSLALFAAEVLLQVDPRSPQAVERAQRALVSEDQPLRNDALNLLERTGEEEAVQGLAGALRLPREEDRIWSLENLCSHHGSTLSTRLVLRATLSDASLVVRSMAALELALHEDPALDRYLPVLGEAMRARPIAAPPDRVRGAWMSLPESPGVLTEALGTDDEDLVEWASAQVLEQGPSLGGMIPGLHALAPGLSSANRISVATCLAAVGAPPAAFLPLLEAGLIDPEPDVRARAARALGEVGPDAIGARGILQHALEDGSTEARFEAAIALAGLGAVGPGVVQVLIEGLSREGRLTMRDAPVRARDALVSAGEAAVAPLTTVLESGGGPARRLALEALREIGPPARQAIPAIRKALRDPERVLAAGAPRALVRAGATAEEAVPALIETLGRSEPEVRDAVGAALEAFGPEARPAVPVLLDLLRDRGCSAQHLARIGRGQPEVVRVLAEGVSRMDEDGRRECALALAEVGPSAREALPELEAALEDHDRRLVIVAAAAIVAIDAARAGDVLQRIEGSLGSEDLVVRREAVDALGRLGHTARRSLPRLIATARSDPDRPLRIRAARAIDRIGELDLAPYLRGLAAEEAQSETAALEALARIGPAAAGAAEAVARVLDRPEASLRVAACRALAAMGPAARAALPALEAVARDRRTAVRDAARAALAAFGKRAP